MPGTDRAFEVAKTRVRSNRCVDPTLAPVFGQVASPRLEQPYTRQTNLGWSHQLDSATAITADYVRVDGRDINIRFRPNTRIDGGPRRLADLAIRPNTLSFRTAVSKGESTYDALIIGLRRRMSHGFDLSASYTLSEARSIIGTANDELDANNIQDAADPFNAVNIGPSTRTDARHRVSISAVVQAPWGIQVAPFFIYRSGLPTLTFEGIDTNNDGNVNDITAQAYQYTGLNDDGTATFKDVGPCENVNCSRRAAFSQLNLRLSKSIRLGGTARIEAIAEVFNLFNAKNPALPITSQRVNAAGVAQASFMQPVSYAGDIGQPEQRIGQLGFRFSF